MLDIALLTANASQLRYVLGLGEQHEFYEIMLGLIITSITLQVLSGIMAIVLAIMDLNNPGIWKAAAILNHLMMGVNNFVLSTDLIKMGFDSGYVGFRNKTTVVLVGILFLIIGIIDINEPENHFSANILNNIAVVLIFIISVMNIIINAFGIRHSNNNSPGST
ncbi:Ninjurin-1 [Armadillidium vulgare]|nr:Ninjurin-1 [Armadillidium vulgare]